MRNYKGMITYNDVLNIISKQLNVEVKKISFNKNEGFKVNDGIVVSHFDVIKDFHNICNSECISS